jgi:hypothetical protein
VLAGTGRGGFPGPEDRAADSLKIFFPAVFYSSGIFIFKKTGTTGRENFRVKQSDFFPKKYFTIHLSHAQIFFSHYSTPA